MSDGMEWRKKGEREWWLVFSDAPPELGEPDGNGTTWPPSMSALRSGCCWHVYSFSNGAMPGEGLDDDTDYMHICDLADTIADLQALASVADAGDGAGDHG